MKKAIFLLILCIFLQSCFGSKGLSAKKVNDLSTASMESSVKLNHEVWTELLQKYVNEKGLVDYKGFEKDRSKLDDYVAYLSKQKPDKNWSVQEELAFYINAYNAFTVQLILAHYPLKSIKDIGGIKGPFLQKDFMIGGKKISLATLEKGILTTMNEPRIHFAINCASISCPKLMNKAYTASKIDTQLDAAVKGFINSSKNKISKTKPQLSPIFKWYKNDFQKSGESVIAFINQYVQTEINPEAKLSYLDYNWSLNEQK